MPTKRLFDSDFVRRVDALRMEASRRGARAGGGAFGEPRASLGFELADFRPYAAGDDLRNLDWSALARWDEPVVRRFRDAQPAELRFVLDRTPSMEFGNPTKETMARRIAGAIGIVALASGIGVQIVGVATKPNDPQSWLRLVEGLPEGRGVAAEGILEAIGHGAPREWIVLSDLYEAAWLGELVERARRAGNPTTVALIWSREDREPPPEGCEAVDAESGERRVFLASGARGFGARREEFLGAWRATAGRLRCGFVEVDAAQSWESAVAAVLAERARVL
jgi:uncharacterized protein (DUF58 family)